MPDIYLGNSRLSTAGVEDFDAVSLTANFGGFMSGRAMASRHSRTEEVKRAGALANELDEVGIVPGNFYALVVPKCRFEEQQTKDWAAEVARDLLAALAEIQAKTLWMTHFQHFGQSLTAIKHLVGILDVFSQAGSSDDYEPGLVLQKVLIGVPDRELMEGSRLRAAVAEAGWELEEETLFIMEKAYRLRFV